MNEILVTIDFEEDSITLDNNFLLVENDYNSTKLKFEFLQNITGRKVFELLKPDGSFFIKEIENNEIILVDYDENGDIIPILTTSGTYKFEIVIYDNNSKITNSKIGKFKVREEIVDENDDNINNDSRIPLLDGLIHETNELKEDVENMDIDATKVDNVATIIITKKDGTSKTIEIHDGEKGKNGEKGEQGEPGIQGPQGEPGIQGEPGKDGFISVTSKNEASGETITIEDALESRLLDLKIEGKSEQETRSGKNVLNYVDNIGSSSSGLTSIVNEDGSITTTGVPEYNYANILRTYDITDILEDGEVYTYSLGTPNSKLYMQLMATNINDDTKTYADNRNGSKSFTVNKSQNTYIMKIVTGTKEAWGTESLTFTNTYQLEKGSVATSFEKYGASPSPDYPSEIKSVGYTNLFDKDNANLINGYNNNEILTTYKYSRTLYIPVKPNTTYTIQKMIASDYDIFRVFSSIDVPTIGMTIENQVLASSKSSVIYTTNSYVNYLAVEFIQTNATTTTLEEMLDSIMIEEGTVAHNYIPYGKYGIDVNVTGKNLFDKDNAEVVNFYVGSNLKIVTSSAYKSILLKCKPNTTYTIRRTFYVNEDISVSSMTEYPVKDSYVTKRIFDRKDNALTITTGENDKFLMVFIYYSTDTSGLQQILDSIQIEENSIATEYEPYKSNTTQLILNEPPRSLPNEVKDETYIENGKLYVERKVGRVVLDGTQIIIHSEPTTGRYDYNIPNAKTKGACLSTHFIYEYASENGNIYLSGVQDNRVSVINASKTSIEEMNSWLSNNNVEVLYELAEPIIEEVGVVSPYTYDGTNHISVDGGLSTIFDIKYAQDVKMMLSNYYTKEEVDKLIADIKSLLIKEESNG